MCEIEKKKLWDFSNLEISIFLYLNKIFSTELFLVFHISFFLCNKKIFINKKIYMWDHHLVFKVAATDDET